MELDDAVLEEAGSRGDQLLVGKLVTLAEKHHDDPEPGVPRSLVEAYVDALDEDSVDAERMRDNLDAHLSDDLEAPNEAAVYDVADARVSGYPAAWHERLDPDDSLADYVAVMTATTDPPKSGASGGVAKDDLLAAATVLSGRSREDARAELQDLRGDGVLVADADQHPRAGVSLAEDVDFEKDDWDKPDSGSRSTE
jgi:hypothetical protein